MPAPRGQSKRVARVREAWPRNTKVYFLNGALNLGDQFDAFFPAQIARVLSGGGVIPVLMLIFYSLRRKVAATY